MLEEADTLDKKNFTSLWADVKVAFKILSNDEKASNWNQSIKMWVEDFWHKARLVNDSQMTDPPATMTYKIWSYVSSSNCFDHCSIE